MKLERPEVNIVVPLYNEEEVFHTLVRRLQAVMDSCDYPVTALLIDDGSRDRTALLLEQIALNDQRFVGIFLSRNFGHQLALSAGLSCIDATHGVLVIDGDLQDPPELIHEFYPYVREGYDVVYGSRSSEKERYLKRTTSTLFYRLFNRITNLNIPLDAGDCCMMTPQVVQVLNGMGEQPRFIRGMRTWVGFKQKEVFFKRDQREHGETKYPMRKMLRLAFDAIFSFSRFPIQLIGALGALTIAVSLIYLLIALLKYYVFGTVIEGFTGLLFVIILFGGMQLFSLAIIGQYILQIFFQVKGRPNFIIKKQLKDGKIIL